MPTIAQYHWRPSAEKMCAHIIAKSIIHHLKKHGLLTDSQHTWLQNKEQSETQPQILVDELLQGVAKGKQGWPSIHGLQQSFWCDASQVSASFFFNEVPSFSYTDICWCTQWRAPDKKSSHPCASTRWIWNSQQQVVRVGKMSLIVAWFCYLSCLYMYLKELSGVELMSGSPGVRLQW